MLTSPERALRRSRHSVSLVEDDELEAALVAEDEEQVPCQHAALLQGCLPPAQLATYLKTFLVLAKLLTCSRTTSIPRSSEALSW